MEKSLRTTDLQSYALKQRFFNIVVFLQIQGKINWKNKNNNRQCVPRYGCASMRYIDASRGGWGLSPSSITLASPQSLMILQHNTLELAHV